MTTLDHIAQLEQQAVRLHGGEVPTYLVWDDVCYEVRVEVRIGPGGRRYVALVPGAEVRE